MPRKTKHEKDWKPGSDDKAPIFVRSDIDEYGLDVYEFRVLAHIARRDGYKPDGKGKGCFAKQKNIAEVCGMSHRKAQDALRVLYEIGIVEKEERQGTTNVYRLALPSKWKHPSTLNEIRKRKPKEQEINEFEQAVISTLPEPTLPIFPNI